MRRLLSWDLRKIWGDARPPQLHVPWAADMVVPTWSILFRGPPRSFTTDSKYEEAPDFPRDFPSGAWVARYWLTRGRGLEPLALQPLGEEIDEHLYFCRWQPRRGNHQSSLRLAQRVELRDVAGGVDAHADDGLARTRRAGRRRDLALVQLNRGLPTSAAGRFVEVRFNGLRSRRLVDRGGPSSSRVGQHATHLAGFEAGVRAENSQRALLHCMSQEVARSGNSLQRSNISAVRG
jgi:hypothetical protein